MVEFVCGTFFFLTATDKPAPNFLLDRSNTQILPYLRATGFLSLPEKRQHEAEYDHCQAVG